MKQEGFEALYKKDWQHFETLLQGLEKRRAAVDSVSEFPASYRRVCHFLALAKEREYSAFLVDQLNDLVLRGHHQLYRFRSGWRHKLAAFLVADFPRLVRREWRFVVWSLLLLYVPALLVYVAVKLEPTLVYSIMGPDQVNQFEDMYNPSLRHIGRPRQSDTDFMMFGYYIYNNIGIAFRCFASGLLAVVGSVFFLVFNGLLLGGMAAHVTNLGYSETFFPFVVGHGAFELNAIALAGAAGMRLGYSVLVPGQYARLEALKLAARQSVKMIYGVILMLLIAAFLEAFWSSSAVIPIPVKFVVAAILWGLVALYLLRSGRRYAA